MSLLREITTYSARPFFTTERDRFSPEYLLRLTFLSIALIMPVIIMIGFLFPVLGIETPDQTDVFDDSSQAEIMFYAVLLAPLIEESLFRSWLGSHKGLRIAFPIIFAAFIFLTFIGFSSSIGTLVLLALAGGLFYYFLALKLRVNEEFISANFKYYFWGSSIVFGLVHLTNFELNSFNPAFVLLVSPQIIAGFVLGYTRMRFGMLACILTHGFYNGTIYLVFHFLS